MRHTYSLIAVAGLAAALCSGCAGPENKLGRGFHNTFEIVRMSEVQRSLEQTAMFEPDVPRPAAFIRGFHKSLARTGVGLYEVVTCPLPPYGPVATGYLTPKAKGPDSYTPSLPDNSIYHTDATFGFSGGDIAPWVPGSRFKVFDN